VGALAERPALRRRRGSIADSAMRSANAASTLSPA